MKILMVNKFFYIKGGSETYYFALRNLLQELGHTVIDFSMTDEKNFPSPYSDYFVNHVEYNGQLSLKEKGQAAIKLIYSFEAKRKLEQLIQKEKPDLAHLHIFQHQISLSILDVLKAYNIPVVYTAHDLQMLCPNYQMLSHGQICEQCKGGYYMSCLKKRCIKDSTVKSALGVIEAYINKISHRYDIIDLIITPSEFYKKKFEEFGIDPDRVMHIPNFLERERHEVNLLEGEPPYYLYLGRLSHEKGIHTLISAAAELGIRLKIVGGGPLSEQLKELLQKERRHNIELLGFRSGQELIDLVGNAKAVVLPSEWYENGPYSAIEALQLGRPLIGADIGGIPELIHDNGFLFPSGDKDGLKDAISRMESLDSVAYEKMVQASYQMFGMHYTKWVHTEMLQKAYAKVGAVLRPEMPD